METGKGESSSSSSSSGDTAEIAKELARRMMDKALEQTAAAQAALDSAIDSAFAGAAAAADFSSDRFVEAKEKVEWIKSQYAFHEEIAVEKIKEGVEVARSHPGLSVAAATGVGLILLKGPRQYLIQTLRRTFVSNEVLISSAKTEVNGLRQSLNLITNENRKLMERSLNAERQFEKGMTTIKEEGRAIERQLRNIKHIENDIRDLKEVLHQLPRPQASPFKSQASNLESEIKREKKVLSSALSRILNYGVSF
ncbi:alanine-tRNA ligase [Rhynchospora pubera]|uniref:Alanine-tRNA ligase n=1 Tax=Rhynchospora pubera TaxID=906938 RepID=A0AAV8GKE9_9POAL|nr:alanine-tRNA ligase [Rhynchospora pubera]